VHIVTKQERRICYGFGENGQNQLTVSANLVGKLSKNTVSADTRFLLSSRRYSMLYACAMRRCFVDNMESRIAKRYF